MGLDKQRSFMGAGGWGGGVHLRRVVSVKGGGEEAAEALQNLPFTHLPGRWRATVNARCNLRVNPQ